MSKQYFVTCVETETCGACGGTGRIDIATDYATTGAGTITSRCFYCDEGQRQTSSWLDLSQALSELGVLMATDIPSGAPVRFPFSPPLIVVDLSEWAGILAQIAGYDAKLARDMHGVCVGLARILEMKATEKFGLIDEDATVGMLAGMRTWFGLRRELLEQLGWLDMKGGDAGK